VQAGVTLLAGRGGEKATACAIEDGTCTGGNTRNSLATRKQKDQHAQTIVRGVGAHLNRGFLSPHSGALAQRVLASVCLLALLKSFLHRSWRFFTGRIPSRAVSIPKHLRVNLPPIVRGASAASQSRCLVAPFSPKGRYLPRERLYQASNVSMRRSCSRAERIRSNSAWHATLTSRTLARE
jgi:hypothetical protein